MYLKERAPRTLNDVTTLADQYLLAHGKALNEQQTDRPMTTTRNEQRGLGQTNSIYPELGDNQSNRLQPWRHNRKCFNCHESGHDAKDCKKKKFYKAAAGLAQLEYDEAEEYDNQLHLANGESVQVVSSVITSEADRNMPVVEGKVGHRTVQVLRDSGCSGNVIKRKFVHPDQYTGQHGYMILADNTRRRAPLARINVNTPYFRGQIEALCLPDAVYDLIIGNIDGAREPRRPRRKWIPTTKI